jgi:hypothetical protein
LEPSEDKLRTVTPFPIQMETTADLTVAEVDDLVAERRRCGVVRHEHDRLAPFLLRALQDRQELDS